MVVISGHSGFIGGELCRSLAQAGRRVAGFSTAQCDLLDGEAVRACLGALPRPFSLVNCAVLNRSGCQDLAGLERNLRMFANLLAAIPPGACRAFIHLSSVDLYGWEPTSPIREDSPLCPRSYYAMAKLDCEWLLGARANREFPAAILRLPGVYGPGDGGRSVIGKLLRQTLAGEKIVLTNGGTVLRDYLLVDDLIRAIELLLADPRPLVLNLVSGQSRSLRDILALICARTGRSSPLEFVPDSAARAGDLVFDPSRLREYLPGFASTSLAEGIARQARALLARPINPIPKV